MKTELLNNPEVKEIAEKYAQKILNSSLTTSKHVLWDDFVREHTKPKEWEIVAFKHNNTDELLILRDDGTYWYSDNPNSIGCKLDVMLNKGCCVNSGHIEIHSVKRLSNGEVFTVGDEVTVTVDDGKGFKNTIHHFTYTSGVDIIDVYFTQQTAAYNIAYLKIEKAKQPLFKTYDGVDVYYGDTIFMIADWKAYAYYAHKPKSNTFSTREKAEEYILMNKPCLSVNDLINFGVIVKNSSCQYNRLLELAKSKQ